MKIVIPGGSGQVGRLLAQAWGDAHEVHVLSRSAQGLHHWDGASLGPWAELLEDADVVINLAGRTVDCRYNDRNLRQMMDSRVRSTRVVGEAIAACARPPRLWLQMSTATIYAHSLDRPNDERSGRIGGWEPDAPVYWKHSIDIALAWERELELAQVPDRVRKVALRTAMVMTPEAGGVFSVLRRMARLGLGGPIAGGQQKVSWIHGRDFVRALEFLIANPDIEGPVNLCAPGPLPQRELMAQLRDALGVPLGLPATAWMAELGALALQTDTELLLKSRYVLPGRLQEAGFAFAHPQWGEAVRDLLAQP